MSSSQKRNREPIADDSGYVITSADMQFLGITDVDVALWHGRLRPLGINDRQFEGLLEELAAAMRADDLSPGGMSLRLKGSSAGFFAGVHKTLPSSREEFDTAFVSLNKRLAFAFELDDIEHRFESQWPQGTSRPRRRPFDSMYRLGIDPAPSDIDLQLSSDEVVERCRHELTRRRLPTTQLRVENSTYNFVNKELVEQAVPRMSWLCLEISKALRRGVSLAVFPSAGPPDHSATLGDLSAHHKDSDWVLIR